MPRKPKETTETPKIPAASVLDRRLLHPFGAPSIPITLKSGSWALRIVDSDLRAGRLHEMRRGKGWEFVEPEELDGTPDEYGFRVVDGRLVRGHNGREVLMKMPQAMYDAIQEAKTDRNTAAVSGKKLRDSVAQETAEKFGSQAGDAVYEHGRFDVKTTKGEDLELEETA